MIPHRHTFYIGKDGKILAIDKAAKTKDEGANIAARLAKLDVAKKPASE
jgi:hypothetical protein